VYNVLPDDGWRGVLTAAGLRVPIQNTAIPDENLLEEFHRVVSEMGRIPTAIQYDDGDPPDFRPTANKPHTRFVPVPKAN